MNITQFLTENPDCNSVNVVVPGGGPVLSVNIQPSERNRLISPPSDIGEALAQTVVTALRRHPDLAEELFTQVKKDRVKRATRSVIHADDF